MIKLSDSLSIGTNEACYIIAEVGSNWHSLDDCLYSVRVAKTCGANAVKFQLFTNQSMYAEPEKGKLNQYSMDPDWLPKLKAECDKYLIDFMCTPFDEEGFKLIDPLVKAHKIASSDLAHVKLLELCRKSGKPVFLSTGGYHDPEIHEAIKRLGTCPVVLMYCVSDYPSKYFDFENLFYLRNKFQKLVGYSDHTANVIPIPELAAKHSYAIEKHVNFIGCKGPDAPHSLNQEEFLLMVQRVRGEKHRHKHVPTDMKLRHNRRLMASKDIKVGDKLEYGVNYGIFRSLADDVRGGSPFLLSLIEGQRATKEIKRGQGIWTDDIMR